MKNKIYSKVALESFSSDQKVMDEVREKLINKEIALSKGAEDLLSRESVENADKHSSLESFGQTKITPGRFNSLEAIVLSIGRPPLLVKNDKYVDPEIVELKNRLNAYRKNLNRAIPSVARIEVTNHPNLDYYGSGWMVDEDILITNRHVASMFSYHRSKSIFLRTDPFGNQLNVLTDFRQEYQQKLPSIEIGIDKVIHIEKNGSRYPDIAFIKLTKDRRLPKPIQLSTTDPLPFEDISVIGYPAEDGQRNDANLMKKLFGSIYNVKRLSPGRVSAVPDNNFVFSHDCTTMGGASGGVVIRNCTGEAIGLHFGGAFLDNNFAIKGNTILDVLAKMGTSKTFLMPHHKSQSINEAPKASVLLKRSGYDSAFLEVKIPMPKMLDGHEDDLVELKDSKETELKYTNFSVKMNRKRKMATYTAVNIDGSKWFHIPRGRDSWLFDPRLERKYQAGNDFYKGNNMHRGHLVRRLDPAWGDSRDLAKQAIEDTFYWTNCTPQHEKFNPKSWLRLEEYILDNAINHDLKVSVFTGPVFKNTDKRYRGKRIPEDYWKVIAFDNSETRELSATAYLMTQSEFMDAVEFAYGQFRTYQVPIKKIIDLTKIDFSFLEEYDPLSRNESISYFEIINLEDIIF